MLLFADRADGVNIVTFDVESKAEFLEIKHFNFLSAAMHGRFPVFRFVDGGFFAPCMVGVYTYPRLGLHSLETLRTEPLHGGIGLFPRSCECRFLRVAHRTRRFNPQPCLRHDVLGGLAVMGLSEYTKGMVLVTGPAGSGKSTTLACLVDRINSTKQDHIITLEDPLEYLHRHKESIVSQREISTDTENYLVALRAALRQSPDVILLGEMRDFETIQTAMTAAETGHLVLSSLHTIGAANTISRIIDVFDASQQRQIAVQLSMVLKAVVSQQLVPAKNGTLVPAFEIMVMTPAISNMIRDNKVHQIDGIIYTSAKEDMISMDNSLLELYRKGIITQETVLQYCTNPEMTRKKL